MARFADKVAMVTGAAQGIGRAVAEKLIDEGARVLMLDIEKKPLADTARALAARAAARCRGGKGRVAAVAGDVSRRTDVHRAVEACVRRFGRIDVLVASAGIAGMVPLLEMDDRSWRRVLDVNLSGTFISTQEVARVMARQGGGSIVVVASTNAFWMETNLAHYNTSKGGVVALVRSAAIDLAPMKIRVNAVEPSVVRTRMAAFVTECPAEAAAYLEKIPLDRFAEPEDVANAVLFLASDEASYITGQALILDGGLTLGLKLPMPGERRQ